MHKEAEKTRQNLRNIMKAKDIKYMANWAKKAGITEGTLRSFLEGRTDSMKISSYQKLAAAAGVSVSELLGEVPHLQNESLHAKVELLTVRGIVQAGFWAEACEWEVDDQYQMPFALSPNLKIQHKPEKLFGLEMRGDSMNKDFEPGSVLICISVYDDTRPLKDGDRVIVRRQSSRGCETTVKQLKIDQKNNKSWLQTRSTNEDYQGILPILDVEKPHIIDDVTVAITARVLTHIPPWSE